jgi:hypothetical protein
MKGKNLVKDINEGLGKGVSQVKRKGAANFYDERRDLGNALPLLFNDAFASTRAVYHGKEEVEVLDAFSMGVKMLYKRCSSGDLLGVALFRDLYTHFQKYENGGEVYATFCAFFFQATVCYMFSTSEIASGLDEFDVTMFDAYDMNKSLTLLGLLDDDTRAAATRQLSERGHWPTTVDYSKLLRRLDDFIELIKADQERRYALMDQEDKDGTEITGMDEPGRG